jgi:hypothetical protein
MTLLPIGAAMLIVLFAAPARAQLNLTDLQLTARVLGFMEKPLTGTVRLGIVYIPDDVQSVQSADAIVALVGGGLKAGNLLFTAVRVPINEVATAQIDAFFLPDGLGSQAGPIAAATEKMKVPCITLDVVQVQNGTCSLGVQVIPKVQIYVNRAAAANSDTTFVSVFRMMITEF